MTQADADAREDQDSKDRRYRAPALEKGLDVLELLASEPAGLTLGAIVQRLGRSHGELFRMVQVLEYREFIVQAPGGGYRLTDKLFALAMEQPQHRSLIEIALPIMRRLALALGQSCHLVFHSRGEIVVAARMESGEQIGFSVRVGYRRPLIETASGMVLYAFQPEEVRRAWERFWAPEPASPVVEAFRAQSDLARSRGFVRQRSSFVASVTDISAPVVRAGRAAAALTVPFLRTLNASTDEGAAVPLIVAAAAEMSSQLVHGDNRA